MALACGFLEHGVQLRRCGQPDLQQAFEITDCHLLGVPHEFIAKLTLGLQRYIFHIADPGDAVLAQAHLQLVDGHPQGMQVPGLNLAVLDKELRTSIEQALHPIELQLQLLDQQQEQDKHRSRVNGFS